MKAMICTSCCGQPQPLQPEQQLLRLGRGGQGEAGQHAERALDEQRDAGSQALLADAERRAPRCCGPVATNGSSTAKTTNGTSTTIRLSR